MSDPFVPADLARDQSVSSITASSNYAACVLDQPDEASDSGVSKIWLVPLDGGGPHVFTCGQDSAPKWSPDGSELAFVSNRCNSGLQAFVIRLGGGEAAAATHMKGGVSSLDWSPDGKKLLFIARQEVDPSLRGERGDPPPAGNAPQVVWRLPYKTDGIGYTLDRETHLFIVDKDGGDAKQLTDGPFDVRTFHCSPDGRQIAFTRTRTGREAHLTDVWVMDADGTNPVQMSDQVAHAQYPIWSPDGRWIAFSGSEKEGDSRSRLWLIDTRNKAVRPLGDEIIEVDSGNSVHWSPDARVLFFILVRRGLQEIASVQVDDGKLDVLVTGKRHVQNLALTPQRLVYTAAAIDQPAEVFTCGHDGTAEKCLTQFNSWWRERVLPEVSLRTFDVPDGKGGHEKIDGWLMLPRGHGEGPFPFLLDVHGGPQSVAFVEFRKTPWRHVMCSRGWAVLALNPVGSSSYGLEFMTRIKNRWGELDLPQHLAAIKTLQDDGVADERLAIYGKSYGGYLAAWAITQTDIFKAAVVSAPVSNIESHFGTSDSGYYVTPYAMCGEPYVDRSAARRLSPLDHMHKARTPTLLLQGKDDQRCPIGQSEEIFATLMRSSDIAVEMVLYPGADHHLVEQGPPKFRIDYVSRLAEWIEQWANRREDDRDANAKGETQSSSGGAPS